jgi:hypothetical protein
MALQVARAGNIELLGGMADLQHVSRMSIADVARVEHGLALVAYFMVFHSRYWLLLLVLCYVVLVVE